VPSALRREFRDGQLRRLSLGIDLVDDYLEFLHCRCRPNTWLSYAYDLNVFFNTIPKPVGDITTADVLRFIRCQHDPAAMGVPGGHNRTGVCTRTLKRRLCAVAGLFSYLLIRDDVVLPGNPVPAGLPVRMSATNSRPRLAPMLRAPQTVPRIVPIDQVQRFLTSLNCYRDKAIFLAMALGGLRKAEVLGLDLVDLQPMPGTVRVRNGKGGRERICYLAPLFFRVLERYQRDERPETLSNRVFVVLKGARRGQPLSVSGLNTIISHHRRRANTPDLSCHRLRHTCLTMLREGGMSLEALQQQAGHATINATRVYLHLSNQALRDEYFKVSERIFRSTPEQADDA